MLFRQRDLDIDIAIFPGKTQQPTTVTNIKGTELETRQSYGPRACVCGIVTSTWQRLLRAWHGLLQLTHLNKHVTPLMGISLPVCLGAREHLLQRKEVSYDSSPVAAVFAPFLSLNLWQAIEQPIKPFSTSMISLPSVFITSRVFGRLAMPQ